MKSHYIREQRKPQFILIEVGGRSIDTKDLAHIERSILNISPFTSGEDLVDDQTLWHEILQRLSEDSDLNVALNVARNRSTPPVILKKLVGDPPEVEKITRAVVGNPSCPLDLIEEVINEKSTSFIILEGMASNPGLPNKILSNLYEKAIEANTVGSARILIELAGNPATPGSTLKDLHDYSMINVGILQQTDIPKQIKKRLARNPSTPVQIFKDLTSDLTRKLNHFTQNPSSHLQPFFALHDHEWLIANNPSAPPDLLEIFYKVTELLRKDPIIEMASKKTIEGILKGLASNPSSTQDLLSRIYIDAQQLQDKMEDMEYVLLNLAENPSTPPLLKENLFLMDGKGMKWNEMDDSDIKAKLIHSSSSTERLEEYKDHENYEIRTAVASNPNTPTRVLEELSRDPEPEVRRGVAHNPNTPPSTLHELLQHYPEAASDVAQNCNCPLDILEELSMHTDRIVRMLVAANNRRCYG